MVANQNGKVTFNYLEAASGIVRTRTLPGVDFLWLVLQHVLPKGFRGVRDYGFLHGNAKTKFTLVRYVLCVVEEVLTPRPRPPFKCPKCQAPIRILAVMVCLTPSPGSSNYRIRSWLASRSRPNLIRWE